MAARVARAATVGPRTWALAAWADEFPATLSRVAMGGGGGSGTRNNNSGMGANQTGWTANVYASAGAPGGGIVMIVPAV